MSACVNLYEKKGSFYNRTICTMLFDSSFSATGSNFLLSQQDEYRVESASDIVLQRKAS